MVWNWEDPSGGPAVAGCSAAPLRGAVVDGHRRGLAAGGGLVPLVAGHCQAGRNVADVHDQPVAVHGVDRNRQPYPVAFFVEGDAVDLEDRDPAVGGKPEELGFGLVRCAHRERVAVGDLLDAERVGQVGDGPLRYVRGLDEPRRATLDHAHGVERGLEREGGAVDEALLVPAYYLITFFDPECVGHGRARLLYLNARDGYGWSSSTRLNLRDVDISLAPTPTGFWVAGQGSDERVDLLDHEGPLARACLDEVAGREQLDGIADGVPGGVVLLHELDLGRELSPLRDLAALDLAAQILGDLPVHRLGHGPSQLSRPNQSGG